MKHRVGFCKDCEWRVQYIHPETKQRLKGCMVSGFSGIDHWTGEMAWPSCDANRNLDCPNFTPKEAKWWEFWK